MSYKIAFASSDGKVVNQHFGRTKQFLIVEVDDKEYKYVETRFNEPSCQEFQHTEDALSKSIELISDCKAVFVARIGQGALAEVESKRNKRNWGTLFYRRYTKKSAKFKSKYFRFILII